MDFLCENSKHGNRQTHILCVMWFPCLLLLNINIELFLNHTEETWVICLLCYKNNLCGCISYWDRF